MFLRLLELAWNGFSPCRCSSIPAPHTNPGRGSLLQSSESAIFGYGCRGNPLCFQYACETDFGYQGDDKVIRALGITHRAWRPTQDPILAGSCSWDRTPRYILARSLRSARIRQKGLGFLEEWLVPCLGRKTLVQGQGRNDSQAWTVQLLDC